MFKAVNPRQNFPQMEEDILKLWQDKGVFKKSIENRRDGKRFTLYEGPPTANGRPGIHHVLSRVFKDVIPRYKVMKGYYAPRIGGWDTHGLPVELEVEKELGFTSKNDIEKYGIAEFNARCRSSVFKYVSEWNKLTERIAYWVDLDNAYITMDNNYIESGWWALKQMWDKGLVYQGHRVTPHCPRCGTSLSSHEVAQGYKDNTEDPSVFIKFEIAKESLAKAGLAKKWAYPADKPLYLLAWTTTPWTLPANTALAVSAADQYAILDMTDYYMVLAKPRLSALKLAENPVAGECLGSDLSGLFYKPLFDPREFGIPVRNMQDNSETGISEELLYPVITTSYVSMDDGTGIVHTAPAYGELDYESGVKYGLKFVHHVDLQGRITGSYPFAGKFVKEADKDISRNLKERGLMFRNERMHHTYPFCWRCDSPLIYYAKQSWYIRTTAVRDELIKGNQQINWYPEHIKDGRFGDWLENNIDWAFSRERYWGTPVPIWRCEKCGRTECVGGIDELKAKPNFKGMQEKLDIHRPYVDEWTYDCDKCGGNMKRVTEVMDCWYDSGAMPVAQYHYPFEPESRSIAKDGRFPADYICEAVDQTRGWFYSLHAISTLIFNRPCYQNVICLGHILDERGEKMSKSRNNVIQPATVLDKYGADAVRWYFYTAAPPGNARRFSEKLVGEVTRQFLLMLWNVYSFFVTYANIDSFTPSEKYLEGEVPELDRWILSELNQLVLDVDKGLDNYDPTQAGRRIEDFVGYLSNWYVRRSRRRFWKSENDADKLSAYQALYTCLVTLSRLLAPFTPFVAEELYQNLVLSADPSALESVHLADFPVADTALIDEQLDNEIRLVMKVSSMGRSARSKAALKVRQPLAEVRVVLASASERTGLMRLAEQVLEELNVKALAVEEPGTVIPEKNYAASTEGAYTVAVYTGLSPELLAEGTAREIVHRLQTMRKSAGFEIADYINTHYQADEYLDSVIRMHSEYIKKETLSNQLIKGNAPEGAYAENLDIDGHSLSLWVAR
ncbi:MULTISPECIES: isoleucine--tRNA ligase [Dehalococcoides]|uniref:Isoleucine--tRNA ligase n=1 Tax=Dehalococcoides mccartyi TaxID=61435 RepID=A0AB38Z8E1_9CHLR|nr:isoleucine--tRNA ligase [Dehalococcoides mccartyi]OBW61709.1 MAG: isoleucine--tRNA ligase [Dehalococcoides mccartyi]WRO06757.1 isoleucine--tRNA ligase [Dehalococcoides mccartyi]